MENLIGIGQYLKNDYEEILLISTDRDALDENWEDWKKNQERAKQQLKMKGLNVMDIIVRPNELVKFCTERGIDIDGKSRSQYISYKTSKLSQK